MRGLLLIMGTSKVFHQMRFLPKSVEAQNAFVRPHPRMGPQMDIDIGLGAQNDATNGALGLLSW